MSLQQALLARVPLAQKQAELQKVMDDSRYALRRFNLNLIPLYPEVWEKHLKARQAYYVAQDQLARMK